MPLSRYQIRNEYSLADPDLYKVADKDDSEALLEGVAMAGLVGVLRQLGDLAQFAAEIFRDLHEEVMTTAARGHGLIVRVQQLEAEFPLVERTLLSQTSHTAFLYNSGIDWHSNPRMDENVVTQGHLPRFVMDSYEECRGPPQLFLLDKFDVAGAGACLKRFTDPSFFKTDSTSSSGKRSDCRREKRTRRVKKRGTHCRNGDTPETFPSTHAKLHQLFLEELIETGGNDPDRRVKLKKGQFTGSLFDKDKRRNYMEKFLDSCSPEQKIVHEICIDALPLTWKSDNEFESALEIVEIGNFSPLKESIHSSPDAREMVVKPSSEGLSERKLAEIADSEAAADPRPNHDSDDGKISRVIYKVRSERAFSDRENKSEVNDDDVVGNSDDAASEFDKYVDALATMESEVETDSECKKNRCYLNLKPIVVDSDASEGLREPHSLFLDSQSLGNSTASEDGNYFFKERQSSSRSISVNSLAGSTPCLDAVVAAVPYLPASNSVADNLPLEHHTYEDVPESETEWCTRSIVAAEADEISETVTEFVDASNSSYRADPNATIHFLDMEATLRENCLPSPGLDEMCSNSAEPDTLSGISDPRHVNQTIPSSLDRTFLDAPERTDSGHCSIAQRPMQVMASRSSSECSVSLPDPETSHDGLLHMEPKEGDPTSSSGEKRSNDFRMADASAIADASVPQIVKPIDGVPDLDFCVTSTEENSDNQYSGMGSREKFNNQELSGTRNPSHTPPDHVAAALPSSQRNSSIKEVFANVEGEEKRSSTPTVGQTETLPLPVCGRLHTSASEFCVFRSTEASETAEQGSLDPDIAGVVSSGDELSCGLPSGSADLELTGGSTMVEEPSPILDPVETEDRLQKLPSEITDAAMLEHHLAETGKHYPWNETGEDQNSVSSGRDEYKAAFNFVAFDSEDVCRDVTSVYSNQPDPVETTEDLDKTESQAVQVDATNGHDCNNKHHEKNESFSRDEIPFVGPSELANSSSSISAAHSDSGQHHDMGRLEHKETGTDSSRQSDVENYPNENSLSSSYSSECLETVQEHPVSATKYYRHNEEELAKHPSADLVAEEHSDSVQDSYYSMCSMSSDGYPDIKSLKSSLAEDAQCSVKFEVIESPLTSGNGHQYLESTSSRQVHLIQEIEENVGSLGHHPSNLEKGSDMHDGESQVKPLLANRQIQYPECVDTEENSAALCDHEQPSMLKLPAQPAGPVLGSSTQPMVESTSFFQGSNMLSGMNQVSQKVENFGQPIRTPGFRVLGMLPAEPQINLDSPPLPPLPPMQWRLSRLQSSSAATQGQILQHTRSQVQPMTLPINDNETNTPTQTSNSMGQLGYSNDMAQQEVLTQPLPDTVSEVSLHNNMNGIHTEDLLSTNSTSIKSQNGIQVSEDSYHPGANLFEPESTSTRCQNDIQVSEDSCHPGADLVEPESLAEGHVAGNDSLVEAKVHADNGVQNDHLEHIAQLTKQTAVDSHVHFLPSSSVHYDWQPHLGLIAPEARRTWLSAYDGMPADAGVYANGVLQKKPPRPRNPLIDEVVAIDKSKLRKVERAKPSVESKPEEGESFLEQLQLRKVERVKQLVESKTQEGESLLEHLQLRKVGERVKQPAEPKSEEREFSLQQLQLRKVGESGKPQTELKTEERDSLLENVRLRKAGERVKSEAGQKSEETESLRVQLRKVSDKVKTGVKQKPEETESPRLQLRKVSERVKLEDQQKPEETECPRVQLRKVSEKVKPDVQQKPEETESPRMQLTKVGQTSTPTVAPKNDNERDSIFEQIRSKSFSLKPAVAASPNIHGPNIHGPRTNLKVAAILEKASNIRQAMAGSDEEDDADSWSDC